jgi:ribosomal protein L18E
VQAVIDMQFDPEAARNIRSAGGGAMVLKQVLATIRNNVRPA